ncbi:MAG: hypothetical protein ABI451_11425 [Dokdonella sp.]
MNAVLKRKEVEIEPDLCKTLHRYRFPQCVSDSFRKKPPKRPLSGLYDVQDGRKEIYLISSPELTTLAGRQKGKVK